MYFRNQESNSEHKDQIHNVIKEHILPNENFFAQA